MKVLWNRNRGVEGTRKDPAPQDLPSKQASPSVERRSAKRQKVSRNLFVVSAVGGIVSILAYTANTLELFKAWPSLQAALYGLIVVVAVFAFVVVAFFLRRWEELSQDANGRAWAEEALSESEARFIQSEQRMRDMTLLSEMSQMLEAARTPDEASAVIVQSMQDLFPHESGALCLLSTSRNVVEAIAVWGESPTTERVFSPDDCWALRRGRLHMVLDAHSGTPCRHVLHHPRGDGYQNRRLPAGTLSLGVAAIPEHGSTTEAVLRAADSALYQAKHEGRDQVVVAEAG